MEYPPVASSRERGKKTTIVSIPPCVNNTQRRVICKKKDEGGRNPKKGDPALVPHQSWGGGDGKRTRERGIRLHYLGGRSR